MRQSGSWMTIWDDRILEIIREEESGTSTELAKRDEIHIAQSTVSRRLQKLSEHDLLRALGNGVYVLTDEGEAYLEEKYDAERERYINGGGSSDGENGADAADGPGINS
ncbi:helix-turn-helix domain-containing protein [Haloarcula sp. KBTZ06]|uniref:helix-turn-helix domain-containing protein n=1 Tax=unclassified Haloarcula TaxID=2624677 RepID=UPI003B438686